MTLFKDRRVGLTAGALVIIGSVVLAACQPATFNAEGKARSVIDSSKQISFDFKSKPICVDSTTPAASKNQRCTADLVTEVSGTFSDAGRNSAWPSGVSMSFEGTLTNASSAIAIGAGIAGSECLADSVVPGAAGTKVRGGVNPACYIGVVTYRSTNKRYPNTTPLGENFLECLASVPAGMVAGASQAMQRLDRPSAQELSGLAFILLYDSDRNAKANNGDRLFLSALCGPYARQTAKVNVLDGETSYAYATCAGSAFGGPVGGVFPSAPVDSDERILQILAAASEFDCVQPITKGDVRVKLVPTTTVQETTTTVQETTTTVLAPTTTVLAPTTTVP